MKFNCHKGTITAHLTLAALAALSFTACDHSNDIGMSVIEDEITIVADSNFTVTASNIAADKIQSRTITQLLGSIDAQGYGRLYSDFVTQFMPASEIDTAGVILDRLTLVMSMSYNSSGYVGDTIVPMGLEVYELNRQLQYPIYSSFGDQVSQYYDPTQPIGNATYSFTNEGKNDSIKSLGHIEIEVEMPNSLRDRLYQLYRNNPTSYSIPSEFAKTFPGLYVRSSYGDGRVVRIANTIMNLRYHRDTINSAGRDTTYHYVGTYYAVSPEIITNNNISYEMSQSLRERINKGDNLLVAPIGQDVVFNFPINDVAHSYRQGAGNLSVVNSLSFSLPVDTIANDYLIGAPTYVLMVRKDKKADFFANNLLPDNKTAFLGTYSSTTGCYEFPDFRDYLIDVVRKGDLTATETQFVITPVSVTTESAGNSYYGQSTEVMSAVTPYVETPVMAQLNFAKAKIMLNYSKQTIKN